MKQIAFFLILITCAADFAKPPCDEKCKAASLERVLKDSERLAKILKSPWTIECSEVSDNKVVLKLKRFDLTAEIPLEAGPLATCRAEKGSVILTPTPIKIDNPCGFLCRAGSILTHVTAFTAGLFAGKLIK